jgi:hypothetical protein
VSHATGSRPHVVELRPDLTRRRAARWAPGPQRSQAARRHRSLPSAARLVWTDVGRVDRHAAARFVPRIPASVTRQPATLSTSLRSSGVSSHVRASLPFHHQRASVLANGFARQLARLPPRVESGRPGTVQGREPRRVPAPLPRRVAPRPPSRYPKARACRPTPASRRAICAGRHAI